MPKQLLRPLAMILAFTLPLAAAAAAELTDEQVRLIQALPPVSKIEAVLPKRPDRAEAVVERIMVLQQFGEMAASIAPGLRDPALREKVNQYPAAVRAGIPEMERALNGRNAHEVAERLYPDIRDGWKSMRGVYERALDGELRKYALGYLDRQIHINSRHEPTNPVDAFVAELPEPWRTPAEKVLAVPGAVWLALLVVWLVLGIAFRTVPFRLLPEDPWKLQRGRKVRPMRFEQVLVEDVKEMERVTQHVVIPKDAQGNRAGPDQVSHTRTHVATLFVRDIDGRESTIKLVNHDFDVRPGHRVLAVWEGDGKYCLFLYNHDLRHLTDFPRLRKFVKMRPWLLIPVWVLSIVLVAPIEPSLAWVPVYATPIVYLICMGIVNSLRLRKFLKKMAPRLVQEAGPPSEHWGPIRPAAKDTATA